MVNGDKSFEFICPSFYAYCDATAIHMFNLKETLHDVVASCRTQAKKRKGVEMLKHTHTHKMTL
jgi:hypothetical protein